MTSTALIDQKKLQELFTARSDQILKALPKHITAEKVIRAVFTEITKNPELQECSIESIYYATIQCAQLGLIPNSLTAEAYLVPRYNSKKKYKECNFQAGYLGLLKLAYQNPLVLSIDVKEIMELDRVDIIEGTEMKLIHKRPPLTTDRGKVIGYYAVANLKNGATRFEVMSIGEIHKHKEKYAQGWEKPWSAWQTSEPSMCKKTVLRKLEKYLPSSVENWQLAEAVAIDERHEMGLSTDTQIIDGECDTTSLPNNIISNVQPSTRSEKLATALYQKHCNKNSAKLENEENKPDPEFLAAMDEVAAEETEGQ